MSSASVSDFEVRPVPGATFGGVVQFKDAKGAGAVAAALEADPEALPNALQEWKGLLLLPGMGEINDDPALLVRLSRPFGPEVENYRETFAREHKELFGIHTDVPEILLVTNMAPVNAPGAPRPEPPLTADGEFPTRFPHRRAWHTDQSFRRPPPDISLFYAAIPSPKGQGQTMFADATSAYETLPAPLAKRVEGLEGIHAIPGFGRSEKAARAGETPRVLLPHQLSRRQPVVRVHPVTGKRSLYLCEGGQMDWVDGPLADMTPGPDGDGAALLYELMTHITQPQFTYTHDWDQGDLIIYDNRSVLHAPTWFDAQAHTRLMWRTTVMGNPGPEYDGEARSWMPASGASTT
jgi:taurine dioxygenase